MEAIKKHALVGDRLIHGEGTGYQDWLNWSGLDALQPLDIDACFPAGKRVLIVAPHPDDEILGCAGLLQQLAQLEREIVLVAVTNGTQSHPGSRVYTAEQLNSIRPAETQAALEVLGIQHVVSRMALNMMDGEVSSQQDRFYQALESLVKPEDILVCTFDRDGHPDHEATGKVVQQLANELQLSCYQVLIWAWHWAIPEDSRIPWNKALKLQLTPQQLEYKAQAIACFKSQLKPDQSTGRPPILSPQTIQRILMPCEVYICD
ncbi:MULTISPECIES: PIG-L deacetylase family protein [unclassified Acinetobacter]|uniref:PIG-L deacetylase family protein n=1 Tax=unclassified Acinetobacter TaxID=196816 RepID=UPI0025C51280|nr:MULTISPECIES: PIG-L deacetylase family protein [unclassified Acinetobacter]